MTTRFLPTQALQCELEIPIQASVRDVWHALCDQTNAWWPADFHMVSSESIVDLEPKAGGHLLESCEQEGSLLWYVVQLCTPGKLLVMAGHIAPPFGGPATSLLSLRLEGQAETPGTCVLHVSDAQFGHVTEAQASSLEDGWRQVFDGGLRAFVEAQVR